MSVLYKLTNSKSKTFNDCQWGPGVTHRADGKGGLCTKSWIHAYEDPRVAILMDPIQGGFTHRPRTEKYQLWEADGSVHIRDGVLKCGCKQLTTIQRIPCPLITIDQRLDIAVRCVSQVCTDTACARWANDFLINKDRSLEAAKCFYTHCTTMPAFHFPGSHMKTTTNGLMAASMAALVVASTAMLNTHDRGPSSQAHDQTLCRISQLVAEAIHQASVIKNHFDLYWAIDETL